MRTHPGAPLPGPPPEGGGPAYGRSSHGPSAPLPSSLNWADSCELGRGGLRGEFPVVLRLPSACNDEPVRLSASKRGKGTVEEDCLGGLASHGGSVQDSSDKGTSHSLVNHVRGNEIECSSESSGVPGSVGDGWGCHESVNDDHVMRGARLTDAFSTAQRGNEASANSRGKARRQAEQADTGRWRRKSKVDKVRMMTIESNCCGRDDCQDASKCEWPALRSMNRPNSDGCSSGVPEPPKESPEPSSPNTRAMRNGVVPKAVDRPVKRVRFDMWDVEMHESGLADAHEVDSNVDTLWNGLLRHENADVGVSCGSRGTCNGVDNSVSLLQYKPSPLSAVGVSEWQEIEITVDSGACDTVMPTSLSPQILLLESAASKSGLEYEVANGQGLPNVGEKKCIMMTENSSLPKRITFQCADVHKPLMSVSRVADLGYECILGADGGTLRDTVTHDVIPLHRRGNLYFLKAWVRQDELSGTPGFTRQDIAAR